ncbi:hypothetical protein DL93DRAFT_2080928 [Clavulina sp. PMI_390]|nr:hypothetical protein DL93DRAFT_2080928 [Clavulina sp. PMI_390]
MPSFSIQVLGRVPRRDRHFTRDTTQPSTSTAPHTGQATINPVAPVPDTIKKTGVGDAAVNNTLIPPVSPPLATAEPKAPPYKASHMMFLGQSSEGIEEIEMVIP